MQKPPNLPLKVPEPASTSNLPAARERVEADAAGAAATAEPLMPGLAEALPPCPDPIKCAARTIVALRAALSEFDLTLSPSAEYVFCVEYSGNAHLRGLGSWPLLGASNPNLFLIPARRGATLLGNQTESD